MSDPGLTNGRVVPIAEGTIRTDPAGIGLTTVDGTEGLDDRFFVWAMVGSLNGATNDGAGFVVREATKRSVASGSR